MEAQTAFVWPQSGVELDTVAAIDLQLVLVIFPDDSELDHPLRDGGNLEGGLIFWILLE